jgi:hypothetical protein
MKQISAGTYTKQGKHDQVVDDEEDVQLVRDMPLPGGFGDVTKSVRVSSPKM